MASRETSEPSKVISLSLDFSFAGGDDLGAGSSDGIQTGVATVQMRNKLGVSSSSSSESTLRFFDFGEGGSGRFKSELQGAAILHNPHRVEENSQLRLSVVQQL